jgi:SAM-dependent methyltransferase
MPWYKNFFENWYLAFWPAGSKRFKPSYIKKEVAFIKRTLNLQKGTKILDLACGHGRHLIPLARAGYQMTGLDLSRKALALLIKNAKKTKVKVRIVQSDMRKIPFKNEFDAAINMFTAFGYLENDQENFKVLKAAAKALKPGGKFLIDISNRDWIQTHFQTKSWQRVNKLVMLEERKYDPKTHRNVVKIQILDSKGVWHKTIHKVRMYSLAEMKQNLARVGLKIIKLFGETYNHQKFTKKSRRLVILAVKPK